MPVPFSMRKDSMARSFWLGSSIVSGMASGAQVLGPAHDGRKNCSALGTVRFATGGLTNRPLSSAHDIRIGGSNEEADRHRHALVMRLPLNCTVDYISDFLTPDEAAELYRVLIDDYRP